VTVNPAALSAGTQLVFMHATSLPRYFCTEAAVIPLDSVPAHVPLAGLAPA
jgi:hypothetical protein